MEFNFDDFQLAHSLQLLTGFCLFLVANTAIVRDWARGEGRGARGLASARGCTRGREQGEGLRWFETVQSGVTSTTTTTTTDVILQQYSMRRPYVGEWCTGTDECPRCACRLYVHGTSQAFPRHTPFHPVSAARTFCTISRCYQAVALAHTSRVRVPTGGHKVTSRKLRLSTTGNCRREYCSTMKWLIISLMEPRELNYLSSINTWRDRGDRWKCSTKRYSYTQNFTVYD